MSYILIVKCNPCIVLSVLRLLKHKQAVYSVKTKTNANLSRRRKYAHTENTAMITDLIVI